MSTTEIEPHNFLAGGGEMGARIRAYNWAATPLGPPENWPQPLKTTVRLMLSTGHPIFIYWGPELIQLYNDAFRRTLGPERHPSALGQRGYECWEETWPIIGHQIEQVMAGKGHTWHENQRIPTTRHGRRQDIYWTYSYSPVDDPAAPNGVGGVLVICSETTQQVLAEQQMKAAEARWRSLFSQAPGLICTLQGPEHRFEFANECYYELIGRRDIIGKTVREVLPEIISQGFVELLDEVYHTGKAHYGSATPVTLADGQEKRQVYLDFVYQPIRDAAGVVTGILVDGYDVTERVEATAVLQEQDRRKDEFLAMLAHELRNPLAPIRNASELLNRTTGDNPIMREIGGLLDRQVTQLAHLVDDLLDISRITQGRVILQQEPMELGKAIESVLEALDSAMKEKDHTIHYSAPEQPLYINGDLTRVVQSLSNVLTNACKYTDPGGRISVKLADEGDNAVIEVNDNGIGISPDMLEKIFELFVQVDHTLDRAQGGLGIGLSLVHRMVRMHGGDITVSSPGLGKGSTFRITLPTIEPPAKLLPEAGSEATIAKCILIVDDNTDAADSLVALLKIHGHQAVAAYGAHEALKHAEQLKPDIVLLDIGLPVMDGYEVARIIRDKGHARKLIALTGYGKEDDVKRGQDAGFDMHFTKPVAFGDLERVLRG